MKSVQYLTILSLPLVFLGCQQNKAGKQTQTEPAAVQTEIKKEDDTRPKEQRYFLDKVLAESDYDVSSNAIKKDAHIAAFNKYALDSLKNIKNWEFKVTEINDNSFVASSIVKVMGNPNAVYNLVLVAPIKIDNSVDSIAITNRVDFVYSIPKEPKTDVLKKQLALIKTLSKNDVVIVSGALTHIDDNGKVNFESFYDQYQPWNLDLLITDIKKK